MSGLEGASIAPAGGGNVPRVCDSVKKEQAEKKSAPPPLILPEMWAMPQVCWVEADDLVLPQNTEIIALLIFKETFLQEEMSVSPSRWENFLANYYQRAGMEGNSLPLVEFLAILGAASLLAADRQTFIALVEADYRDAAAWQVIKEKILWAAGEVIRTYDGFNENNDSRARAYLYAALNLPIDDPSVMCAAKQELRQYLLAALPQFQEITALDQGKFSAMYEEYAHLYEALPSGDSHKKSTYGIQVILDMFSWTLDYSVELKSPLQDERLLQINSGEQGLACSSRVEDLPPELKMILEEGQHYQYVATFQENGIIFGDLIADNAFTTFDAVYIENWQNDPFDNISYLGSLVHEAAHNELNFLQQLAGGADPGPTYHERYATAKNLSFLDEYLKNNGTKLKQANPDLLMRVLNEYVSLRELMEYYNWVLGLEPGNLQPDSRINDFLSQGQSMLPEAASSHHPEIVFCLNTKEIADILKRTKSIPAGTTAREMADHVLSLSRRPFVPKHQGKYLSEYLDFLRGYKAMLVEISTADVFFKAQELFKIAY